MVIHREIYLEKGFSASVGVVNNFSILKMLHCIGNILSNVKTVIFYLHAEHQIYPP